ncbi:GDP-fucose protein O-fucosyltransferase 2 [Amphibalanus amphitrite]|uniref:GDP-fucose protein O-fucosyltransferase 2 n=1 Tax=Amphibalanus amphitrite TaxID=1232801 RepID=A0A6A4VD95_AMPAM|nr:GDP-fucose protein O-fucosyltransferase 2 [Amphibalanus amphitrite]
MTSLQFPAFLLLVGLCLAGCEDACYKDGLCEKQDTSSSVYKRYLLYDVNPGEGFNLRRDVYMRVAVAVARLRGWTLVLPPWGPLYHWQATNGEYETGIPWARFFDVASLNRYVPVMEFDDFVKESGARVDAVLHLQNYAEGWRDGHFDEKWHVRPCLSQARFSRSGDVFSAQMWSHVTLQAANYSCVSIQGTSSTLAEMCAAQPHRSILVDRAETVLHHHYGGRQFWSARRSMRFARHLVEEAAALRRDLLASEDEEDGTRYTDDWRDMKVKAGSARGGPYLAVHLRRRDFVSGRPRSVPSLETAARAISATLRELGLETVYLATDAPDREVGRLRELLEPFRLVRPPRRRDLLAGEEAIIDQIVCSHARHFIGSYESTFSFRIQEEREILGFSAESTFNRLCGDREGASCEQPTRWRIVYA